jgi:S-(hydroxymethyl)mycothiol dehydrogenase
MSMTVRGVIARSKGAPVEVTDIVVPDPGPGEARVTVQACGVCHTDLHYREGGISDDFPFLLGHEAAGIVESVGEGVTEVEVGDYVVLNWRAVCGECRACAKGQPQYCFNTHNATQQMTLTDGTPLSPALGIGSFCEATLVAAGQCTKVNPEADPAAAGLLGCGVMAGFGAAVNTGEVSRGDSVAVFGCGGVGDAAIAGAALAGATTIIAVDRDPKKLELATQFGATHTVDASSVDPVEAIQDATGGSDVGGEVLAGEGAAIGGQVGGRALEHHPAAVVAGARAEVDDPVGVRHHRLVVLDDDDRLAGVDQAVEQAEQLLDVGQVQARWSARRARRRRPSRPCGWPA